MNRVSTRTLRNARKGLASRMAMAVALASGSVLAATAVSTPADAQEAKPEYTKDFTTIYQPVADAANAESGDYAAVKAQLPGVIAAVSNATERHATGQLVLVVGNKLNDKDLQRQGLELMLDSGQVPAAQVGPYQLHLGQWAYDAGDYAEARRRLQAALDAGYTEGEAEALIAETYFKNNEAAAGLDYLGGLVEKRRAAGQAVPDAWLLRGLKVAYDNRLLDKASDYSAMLVVNSPTQQHWMSALQVIKALSQLDRPAELDLLRLMRATDALSQPAEYRAYVEAAGNGGLPREVLAVLDAGLRAGVFSAGDSFYAQNKERAQSQSEADREDPAALAAEARSAATGVTAQGAGDVFYSLGDHARAAEMYQVALEKGVRDREMVLTRLGMAQAQAGSYAEARTTLRQIAGPRAPIAKLWMAYVDTKAG